MGVFIYKTSIKPLLIRGVLFSHTHSYTSILAYPSSMLIYLDLLIYYLSLLSLSILLTPPIPRYVYLIKPTVNLKSSVNLPAD